MNLRKMIKKYQDDGLNRILGSARVSQDIVLKAIVEGPLNRNITIKGGVVLRNITNDNRIANDQDLKEYGLGENLAEKIIGLIVDDFGILAREMK